MSLITNIFKQRNCKKKEITTTKKIFKLFKTKNNEDNNENNKYKNTKCICEDVYAFKQCTYIVISVRKSKRKENALVRNETL
jgi:surface antigen